MTDSRDPVLQDLRVAIGQSLSSIETCFGHIEGIEQAGEQGPPDVSEDQAGFVLENAKAAKRSVKDLVEQLKKIAPPAAE